MPRLRTLLLFSPFQASPSFEFPVSHLRLEALSHRFNLPFHIPHIYITSLKEIREDMAETSNPGNVIETEVSHQRLYCVIPCAREFSNIDIFESGAYRN